MSIQAQSLREYHQAMNANMLQAQVRLIPAKLLQHCCSTVVWNDTSDSAKQCSMDLHSASTCKLSTPIQSNPIQANTEYQWLVHHFAKGPLVGFFLAPQGCFVYHGTPSKLDLKEGILIVLKSYNFKKPDQSFLQS